MICVFAKEPAEMLGFKWRHKLLSEKRDEPAARGFFEKAIGFNGLPDIVTMDKRGANKAGIDTSNLLLAIFFF